MGFAQLGLDQQTLGICSLFNFSYGLDRSVGLASGRFCIRSQCRWLHCVNQNNFRFFIIIQCGRTEYYFPNCAKPRALAVIFMKVSFLLIILQFASFRSFCQVEVNSVSILETILRKEHPNGTLVYTDRLDSGLVKGLRESLKGRLFIGKTSSTTYDTIQLTRTEKKYLDSSVNGFYSNFWEEALFENSRRIPIDSMWTHIAKRNRESYESRQRDTATKGSINFIRNFVENANTFQFSPPVYFRNKSIFIFFFIRMCGSTCGINELSFYRLENGTYKKWFIISGGAF
jgi:hypothetical protein